jgi:type I restriction enzyme R subunit
MMIDHPTEQGSMEPRLLYTSPFTDIDPLGVAGVFGQGEIVQLIQILDDAGEGCGVTVWSRSRPSPDSFG